MKLACTEWNWIKWGPAPEPPLPFHWTLPSALGVARNLHGMIRAGDRVALATQSMLVGSRWNFAAVRFDPAVPDSAHFSAQGQVTDFYRHTVGNQVLQLEYTKGMETLAIHVPETSESVPAGAAMDTLASKDGKRISLHLINRYRQTPVAVTVRLEGFGRVAGTAQLQTLTVDPARKNFESGDPLELKNRAGFDQRGHKNISFKKARHLPPANANRLNAPGSASLDFIEGPRSQAPAWERHGLCSSRCLGPHCGTCTRPTETLPSRSLVTREATW